jgi:hypothetical protein
VILLAAPGVAIAALALTAPGLLWAVWCYPSGSLATRVTVGLALGLAFQWHVCALLAAGPGITVPSVALATIGGMLLAGTLAWRKRRSFRIMRLARDRRHTVLLLAILGISAAITSLPLAAHAIPQGWDPSFHVLLASTTIATGHLPTWTPYEQIPLNYPYGPHIFIAEISLLTGIAPDQVFGVLLNLLTPLATGLALYTFARQVWCLGSAALGAVAAYALLGNWGSLDYGRWGGLPNALGFLLLLAFLAVFFARGHSLTRVLVGGVLLGAIPLAHHHVMLTTALLLIGYGVYLGARALTHRSQSGRNVARRHLRRLGLMALVASVTVSYYAVPYALHARDVQNSEVLRYPDHFTGLLFERNGWLLWALAGFGSVALAIFRHPPMNTLFARRRTGALAFSLVASALLLVAFLLGYYGYRAYSLRVYHQPYAAFTPTRFLTDLTYLLAVFAGPPLALLWRWAGEISWRRGAWWSPVTRSALRGTIALSLIATAVVTIQSQFVANEGHLQPGEAAAFAWIQHHTPANAVVVNLGPTNRWAPYFTRREVTTTPVPVSEFTTGYVAEKRYLANVLLALLHRDQLVAFAADGSAFPALVDRPVALLSNARLSPSWDTYLRFRSGPELVYLLDDAFGQMLTPTASARWWNGQRHPPTGWQTISNAVGWDPHPPVLPVASGTVYLRVTVPGASSPPLHVSCASQGGGRLYIDGKIMPDTCTGSWQSFPELAVPGTHTLAFAAIPGHDLGPWFDVAIVSGSE